MRPPCPASPVNITHNPNTKFRPCWPTVWGWQVSPSHLVWFLFILNADNRTLQSQHSSLNSRKSFRALEATQQDLITISMFGKNILFLFDRGSVQLSHVFHLLPSVSQLVCAMFLPRPRSTPICLAAAAGEGSCCFSLPHSPPGRWRTEPPPGRTTLAIPPNLKSFHTSGWSALLVSATVSTTVKVSGNFNLPVSCLHCCFSAGGPNLDAGFYLALVFREKHIHY